MPAKAVRPLHIHPFPARMASEIALAKTQGLEKGAVVLDPMAGSGTVLRAAAQNGCRCSGLDVDPLAVLMTKVGTTPVNPTRLNDLLEILLKRAYKIDLRHARLPWFDEETDSFVSYWFAKDQRNALTRLALALHNHRTFSDMSAEANALRLAISKLIVTKDRGASLARDVSHSRPHRVATENDFDVFVELRNSSARLVARLGDLASSDRPRIRLGDARSMKWIRDRSIDMVMTSPPYLNAIDYMRGHRLSLVWLGYSLSQLRQIRSNSIGAERSADQHSFIKDVLLMRDSFGRLNDLPLREQGMIERYSLDLLQLAHQTARVLKPRGKAVFVMGNSCLKGTFISNSRGLEAAAKIAGLVLVEEQERELPQSSRYLPMPKDNTSALGKRMRTETVMTFSHARIAA